MNEESLKFDKIKLPNDISGRIYFDKDGNIQVPNNPIIPYIEGDGIGKEVMDSTRQILDSAVESNYGNNKKLEWLEIYAGEKARQIYDNNIYLPEDTVRAIHFFNIGIKGPLTTPVGKGIRSLNVALRKILNLYACVRPIKYFEGIPSPLKEPEKYDLVIFRENTEDVYAGLEWIKYSEESRELIKFVKQKLDINVPQDSGIGLKPISEMASKNLVRKAIKYAIDNNRKFITLVHKGNIMKYTEGAFMSWGYQVGNAEFRNEVITESKLTEEYNGKLPDDKNYLIIKDRIADNMFQELLLKPEEHSVIATTNLNGDYLSDAAAACVGGLGMSPGANIGDYCALFEATHGTAPSIAGKNIANPCSLILSGVMMLDYLGWKDASSNIIDSIKKTITSGKLTSDLAQSDHPNNKDYTTTTDFTKFVIANL